MKRAQDNDERLRAGNWRRAESAALRLRENLPDDAGAQKVQSMASTAALQHALALAGRDQLDDARWSADVARAFDAALPLDSLGQEYGEAGRQVATWIREANAFWDATGTPLPECGTTEEDGARISMPQLVEVPVVRTKVERPFGLVTFSLVVDEEGYPRAPQLVRTYGARVSWMWNTIDTFRPVRFTPALRDDQPVACRKSELELLQIYHD